MGIANKLCIANRLHSEMVSTSDISCEMETCSSNEFVEQVYADITAGGEGAKLGLRQMIAR
jgi:hypothetical protein